MRILPVAISLVIVASTPLTTPKLTPAQDIGLLVGFNSTNISFVEKGFSVSIVGMASSAV
jgi:hypothetical protein